MEKLVQVVVSWLNTFSTHDYPLPMPQDKKEHFAKLIITDTLKAVVDGDLELLGEVGREWLRYTYPPGRLELIPFEKWLGKIIEQAKQSGSQTLFIALSPTGTPMERPVGIGKDEEK